jgi:hypothetical protein
MGYYRPGLVEVPHNQSLSHWLYLRAAEIGESPDGLTQLDTGLVDQGYARHFAGTLRFYLDHPRLREEVAATGARLFRQRPMRDALRQVLDGGC